MTWRVAIVGAGPAGLFAAETLAAQGVSVALYERMPSAARKFLMAGRGGLNLTHSEPLEKFLPRYGDARPIQEAVRRFPPEKLRAWADGLGAETFVGSSGRIFPKAMKASPLLRAWLTRLSSLSVRIETRRDWRGWDGKGHLLIADANGAVEAVAADATILACGGASWPRLGSDGGWTAHLEAAGVVVASLRPSNAGVRIGWSETFASRFVGAPLKRIAITVDGETRRGEAIITRHGLEGGAVYALSAALREAIVRFGSAGLLVDLRPELAEAELAARLARSREKDSLSTRLRRGAGLSPAATGLLREATGNAPPRDAASLAKLVKALPLRVAGLRGIERAISTAGGVRLDALDDNFMLRDRPGVFLCGEMLDFDAPTGGYLLQAALATGHAAAKGAWRWLERRRRQDA